MRKQLLLLLFIFALNIEIIQNSNPNIQKLGEIPFQDDWQLYSIALSHDNTKVVGTGGKGRIEVFDTSNFTSIKNWDVGNTMVQDAVFSHNDRILVTGNFNKKVQVWNAANNYSSIKDISIDCVVHYLVFTKDDSKVLVACKYKHMFVLDANNNYNVLQDKTFSYNLYAANYNSDDSIIAVGGNSFDVELLRTSDYTLQKTLTGGHSSNIKHVQFSKDDQYIISADNSGYVTIWDGKGLYDYKIFKSFKAHNGRIVRATISNDSSKLITGGYDDKIKIWNFYDDYSLVAELDTTDDAEKVLITTDDSRIYAGTYDKKIYVYELKCSSPLVLQGTTHCCNAPQKCVQCQDGMYQNDWHCQFCDNSKCATCSISPQNCVESCHPGCTSCTPQNVCNSCKPGYFDDGSGTCPKCHDSCITCQNEDTTCITPCQSPCKSCNMDASCATCNDGQFLNGSTCTDCNNTKCATCSDINTCILECGSTCKECDVNADCTACEEGEFLENSSKECKACDNTTCGTCINDAVTCQTHCDSSCKTCGTNGKCLSCEEQYFLDNNTKLCVQCDTSQCATCTGTSAGCQKICNDDCKNCDYTGQCTHCEIQQFLLSGTCNDCDDTVCGTCKDTNIGCIVSCKPECKTCDELGDCKSCEEGEFLTLSKTCQACDNKVCGTCKNNENSCIEPCLSECDTCNITGKCITCPIGQFLENNLCPDCNFKCKTCKTTSTNCQECSHPTRDFDNSCKCKSGYYQVSQEKECQKCSFKCGECENTENNCKSCSNSSRQGPDCNCSKGYYDVPSTGECKKCKHECNCVVFDYCSECFQKTDLHLRNPSDCKCKLGYFENSQGECQQCSLKCKSCSGDENSCDECSTLIQNLGEKTPECNCKQGFYYDKMFKKCSPCKSNCLACSNKEFCDTCLIPYVAPPNCDRFRNAFFEQQNQGVDQQNQLGYCNQQCKTCKNSKDNCTQCSIGINRSSETPNCSCIQGYHDNNSQTLDCFKCPVLCETCVSNTLCYTCVQNSEIVQGDGVCTCKQGYKFQQDKCVQCFIYEEECLLECPENTQVDKSRQTCEKVEFYINNQQLIIYCSASVLLIVVISVALILAKKSGKKMDQAKFQRIVKSADIEVI